MVSAFRTKRKQQRQQKAQTEAARRVFKFRSDEWGSQPIQNKQEFLKVSMQISSQWAHRLGAWYSTQVLENRFIAPCVAARVVQILGKQDDNA